ncbi:hypothetical protein HMN09_01389700 [Mycena chlorophos]|uniref:Non-structural maintenance of chromosomes element 4 n=1 Tax=Mycena chlorophos TaxID=658473 RepID=A0A8H6VU99_MYCCL|nr:hypothetical protein HMN09_01389700 [Mycena chlorophos]
MVVVDPGSDADPDFTEVRAKELEKIVERNRYRSPGAREVTFDEEIEEQDMEEWQRDAEQENKRAQSKKKTSSSSKGQAALSRKTSPAGKARRPPGPIPRDAIDAVRKLEDEFLRAVAEVARGHRVDTQTLSLVSGITTRYARDISDYNAFAFHFAIHFPKTKDETTKEYIARLTAEYHGQIKTLPDKADKAAPPSLPNAGMDGPAWLIGNLKLVNNQCNHLENVFGIHTLGIAFDPNGDNNRRPSSEPNQPSKILPRFLSSFARTERFLCVSVSPPTSFVVQERSARKEPESDQEDFENDLLGNTKDEEDEEAEDEDEEDEEAPGPSAARRTSARARNPC